VYKLGCAEGGSGTDQAIFCMKNAESSCCSCFHSVARAVCHTSTGHRDEASGKPFRSQAPKAGETAEVGRMMLMLSKYVMICAAECAVAVHWRGPRSVKAKQRSPRRFFLLQDLRGEDRGRVVRHPSEENQGRPAVRSAEERQEGRGVILS
jgi:hypothetical protein